VANGVAHNQFVDMYNFWQQIKHSGEKNKPYMAIYLEIDAIRTGILTAATTAKLGKIAKQGAIHDGYYLEGNTTYKIAFEPSNELYNDERTYAFENPIDVQNVVSTGTGYRLGGHLATTFDTLY
jgi:hypothetical protein